MEEQQLEEVKERKKKEAEGRKAPEQELSKFEKETFVTSEGLHEHKGNEVFSDQTSEGQKEALRPKSSFPRYKSGKDKERALEMPRPKVKAVVMKLPDEIENRKRIEPAKSKLEFSRVNDGKSERGKISIKNADAIFYPKVEETAERNVLKPHTKELNGKEIVEDLKTRRVMSEGVSAEEEAPEIELFELFIKSSIGNFPKGISIKRPVLVILAKSNDDNYGPSLQIICREIFHELIGGLPYPVIVSGEKETEGELRAENRIVFIDDSRTEYFTSTSSRIKTGEKIWDGVDWEKIGKKLNEFYAQGFGFVIFQIQEEFLKEFKEQLEEITGDLRPQIIELYPRYTGNIPILTTDSGMINVIKLKMDIASAVWGFIVPENDTRWSKGDTFSNFFTACEEEFDKRLEEIGRKDIKVGDKRIPLRVLVTPGENETDLHYLMKAFIVKFLIEKERYNKEMIKTETPLDRDNKMIPDIQVNNRAIEVETLYGTGVKYHDPINKVVETIRKYENRKFKLQIILKNLDLFFYHKDLEKLKKVSKDEWDVDVEFFGLNLDKEEPVPLNKFVKFVKSLFEAKEEKNEATIASCLFVENTKFNYNE